MAASQGTVIIRQFLHSTLYWIKDIGLKYRLSWVLEGRDCAVMIVMRALYLY